MASITFSLGLKSLGIYKLLNFVAVSVLDFDFREQMKLDEASLTRQPEEVFDVLNKLGEGSYGSVYNLQGRPQGVQAGPRHQASSRRHRLGGDLQGDIHHATVRLRLRREVLRVLLQEHGLVDRDGVLRGGLWEAIQ